MRSHHWFSKWLGDEQITSHVQALLLIAWQHSCQPISWFDQPTARLSSCYVSLSMGLTGIKPIRFQVKHFVSTDMDINDDFTMQRRPSTAHSVKSYNNIIIFLHNVNIEDEWYIYASVNKPWLVQTMACHQAGATLLSKPVLEYF